METRLVGVGLGGIASALAGAAEVSACSSSITSASYSNTYIRSQ